MTEKQKKRGREAGEDATEGTMEQQRCSMAAGGSQDSRRSHSPEASKGKKVDSLLESPEETLLAHTLI